MLHTCHALNCETPVSPRMLMCPACWRLVPKALQQAVWQTYRQGQEVTKDPSPAYLKAARAAIEHVAIHQGYARPQPPDEAPPATGAEGIPLTCLAGYQPPLKVLLPCPDCGHLVCWRLWVGGEGIGEGGYTVLPYAANPVFGGEHSCPPRGSEASQAAET